MDIGIGPAVATETVPGPEWRAVPGKPHHYVNAKGQKRYAPPVPDCPMHPTPWDIWREYLRKQGREDEIDIVIV
jgi:hypothetical protein